MTLTSRMLKRHVWSLLMLSVSIVAFSMQPASAINTSAVAEGPVSQETIQVRICSGTNDAEESVVTGKVSLNSADLDLVEAKTTEIKLVGLRFPNLAIPPGSTIRFAHLQFTTDEPDVAPATFVIKGEARDNASPFTAETFNLSTRTATSAEVVWTPDSWATPDESGAAQRSPDLTPVLQEVIDQPDWRMGNAIVFLVSGSGRRVAKSYDGSPDATPQLEVRFVLPHEGPRLSSSELPILPHAEGFGIKTLAGRGGQIIQVTTLADDGPGSLREALSVSGPRVIVFAVGGNIQLRRDLEINNPFVTVAGQTAPSPGITLTQAGLWIQTHDVLVQHLRIRVGDLPDGPNPENRDGIQILGTPEGDLEVYNVVIDHCSISWAIDEGVSTWYWNVHDITVRHSIISENLAESLHPKGEHSKGLLIGHHSRNIAVIGNLFAHNTARNPLITGDVSALIVNNIIYNPGNEFITMFNDIKCAPSTASIVGNVLQAGSSSTAEPIILIGHGMSEGTSVYLADNATPLQVQDPWSVAMIQTPFDPKTKEPPIWTTPLTVLPSSEVKAFVLASVGARPLDRDPVDERIINDVRMGTGRIINSQDDVNGWPQLPSTSHNLEIPANPNGDDDNDGYTNVEEWLYARAAALEGRVPAE